MDLANLWIEPAVIVTLILATGFFAAAEMSTVSLRQSRVAQLIKENRRGAKAVEALKEQPARFLATVQVGMTVVASMASVLGGAGAVGIVQPLLEATGIPFLQQWAGPIALGTTVAVISYL